MVEILHEPSRVREAVTLALRALAATAIFLVCFPLAVVEGLARVVCWVCVKAYYSPEPVEPVSGENLMFDICMESW